MSETSPDVKLIAVIYCQPEAKRFSGEPLSSSLELNESLPPSRPLGDNELHSAFISPHLRPPDVPLAFHRESPGSATSISPRTIVEMGAKLEAQGRTLQYLFSDGLILNGNQILYHPYTRNIFRHFLPLSINVRTELREKTRMARMPNWQMEAEYASLSVLMNVARHNRMAGHDESVEPLKLLFAHSDDLTVERTVTGIESVEISSEGWGPWRVNTGLQAHSGVHYGRARVELDPNELGDLRGLAVRFFLDTEKHRLVFHSFEEQLQRLKAQASSAVQESGLSLHLSGHAVIQSTVAEINDLWKDRALPITPGRYTIEADKVRSRLLLTGDGSFRFITLIDSPIGELEAHGLPQSTSYIWMNLQNGLGATTGFANTSIAHARRGMKRDRDIKVLKNLGFSALIFFDAASFALGLPLSDGSRVSSEEELCASLFERLGSLILKAEGWPTQSGSLVELCSKNVTTLIEGFVKQVVGDLSEEAAQSSSREIAIYLPEGEFRLRGLQRSVALLFHAMISDLAIASGGSCFTKARTKFFDDFMNGRVSGPDRDDLAVRHAVDAETSARMVYQPGINERYRLPEASAPPRGTHVLGLLHRGFEISIDGKAVEEFEAAEFRPEFDLQEGTDNEPLPLGTTKLDWFELHPKFFFKGTEITGEQASRLSREGMFEFQGKLYRVKAQDMPSLQRLTRFWATIQAHNAGLMRSKRRKTEETYYQLPRSQTLELLALRASGVKMRGGPRWEEVTQFYDSLDKPREALQLPETFHAKLQPYQIAGVQWIRDLHRLGLGGILADDMGLGKTVTSLAFLELLRSEGKMGRTLVMVPTSLTYNWLSEAGRFTPEVPVHIFAGRESEQMLDFVRNNESGLVVCTYGLLQEHNEVFQQVGWTNIIFDEAQNLKNITTKRTTAARKLQAGFKLCLTGTPIENHYGELYSLFDLIVPGALGDLATFRERFVNPTRVLREEIDYLRLKTKPLLLRRTKQQVMNELPPKVEATVKLPFEDQQRRIYRDIAASYNEQVKTAIAKQGEAKTQLQMLTALLRLRQACSDPSAIPGITYNGEPPKITTLIEALEGVTEGGASALVFTQFLSTFERIRAALTASKIRHFDISGADSRLNREKKLRAFQEEETGSIMLMTLKTGGVGLNLVKASYIFHVEPWWNPAVENQATDRAHRIGQTKTVQVYRYIIKDSVEEKIEILKDIKSKRFDALFAQPETEVELGAGQSPDGTSALSQQDFEYLLS